LRARRIAVEQTGKNDIFFGNAAGAPGNRSYYSSLNDFETCIQFVFSFMYLHIYVSMYLSIYTWSIWTDCRRCLSAIGGAPGDGNRVNLEMHLEGVIE
jgi:hypothetical protein